MTFMAIVNEAKQKFNEFQPQTVNEAAIDSHIGQLLDNLRIAAENLEEEVAKRGP
ncbi:hypothetical protein [Methyloceanibacter caenitepidi]|uniref:Uncharacterized protein n=1 Tax=Methyloceanibacter caenitepidi TaxID=1384459 RepID=A0A0A8K0Q9_9HYPH|nr:hypothetical protein [Methyloceanibacter caenitepidi]BAQ16092.1 hypothetical protein GL4_0629 [Methyloceanibacter caenitepidi]